MESFAESLGKNRSMISLLMLLTMAPEITRQYYSRLRTKFPQLDIHLIDHHSKGDSHIARADILMTFAPMLTDDMIHKATNLKWIQALGTGVDNLVRSEERRVGKECRSR